MHICLCLKHYKVVLVYTLSESTSLLSPVCTHGRCEVYYRMALQDYSFIPCSHGVSAFLWRALCTLNGFLNAAFKVCTHVCHSSVKGGQFAGGYIRLLCPRDDRQPVGKSRVCYQTILQRADDRTAKSVQYKIITGPSLKRHGFQDEGIDRALAFYNPVRGKLINLHKRANEQFLRSIRQCKSIQKWWKGSRAYACHDHDIFPENKM